MTRKVGKHGRRLVLAVVMALCVALATAGCTTVATPAPEQPASQQAMLDGTSAADLDTAVARIREFTDFQPRVGVVLGSGLGGLADQTDVVATIPYAEIEGFPVATAPDHDGEYVFGYLEGVPVVLMDGRVHYYEGYDMKQVVLPACVMARLGVDAVILTNAVGSLNPEFQPGTLMCIDDHIASFVPLPLIGPNDSELGERFTDMSQVYDPELREILHSKADELGITLHDGIFLQVTGPAYETPAEARLYASLGADTVGMSTATETIALHHMGARVLGINCITNIATLDHDIVTSHEQVTDAAEQASEDMIALITATVVAVGKGVSAAPSAAVTCGC